MAQGVGISNQAAGTGVAEVRAEVSPTQDASGNTLLEQAVQLPLSGGAVPEIVNLLNALLTELRLQRQLFAEAFNLPDYASTLDDQTAPPET